MSKRLPQITVMRAYDIGEADNGYRILVDRLWPRGLTKQELHVSEWLKELAPSAELRRWFDHRPERWDAFRKRYASELRTHRDEVDRLVNLAARRRVVLLFGARDVEYNNAVALREILEAQRAKKRRPPAHSRVKK